MKRLGVNIDHVASLREARKEIFPSPVDAALLCIKAGADSIVAHLREDRRHINDEDIKSIRKTVERFDMEMAATAEMQEIALKVKPDIVTLVPEKRQEVTTEGGLNVMEKEGYLKVYVKTFQDKGIPVSLFVDPDMEQIKACARTGARFIEVHTGEYANNFPKGLRKIKSSVVLAKKLGLRVNAGHGLTLKNISPVAKMNGIEEFNIGFSIIAEALFVGLDRAVKAMKEALNV